MLDRITVIVLALLVLAAGLFQPPIDADEVERKRYER